MFFRLDFFAEPVDIHRQRMLVRKLYALVPQGIKENRIGQ